MKLKILAHKYFSLCRALLYKFRVVNFLKMISAYLVKITYFQSLPFVIQIEPTNRCNLKCSLCITGTGKLRRSAGNMTFEEFEKIIKKIDKNTFYLGLYNLGESLLNPDIYKMIIYAKEKRMFTRLSTNAFFDNEENIVKLMNSGIDELIISLDCATPQTYTKYKGIDGFQRVIRNIKLIIKERANKLNPIIVLQLLIMKETENEIKKFKELAHELKVDKTVLKTLRINFPGVPGDKSFLPNNLRYIRKAYINRNDSSNKCFRPWVSAVILWDGSIVPCCFDMEGEYNFGNIHNQTFEEIWRNEKYVSFRKEILKINNRIGLCKECSLNHLLHNIKLYS
ncbi:MAG: radical SAM/SPASM domain-containing protein [Candidatus Omnitrophota bacterium]